MAGFFGGVEVGKNVHRLAQDRIWKIGKDLGFHSITEFTPPNTVIQRRSDLIDVVWKSEKEVEFAFEIRARARDLDVISSHDDVVKLRNLQASKKFVVNVSNKSGKAYFSQIDGDTTVRVTSKEASCVPDNLVNKKLSLQCENIAQQIRDWCFAQNSMESQNHERFTSMLADYLRQKGWRTVREYKVESHTYFKRLTGEEGKRGGLVRYLCFPSRQEICFGV